MNSVEPVHTAMKLSILTVLLLAPLLASIRIPHPAASRRSRAGWIAFLVLLAAGLALAGVETAEAERIRRSAELHLRNERDQAYNALRSDIGRLAVQLSERVVGESLSDSQAVGRTVDRFLAELDAQPSRVVPDYVPDSLAGPEGAGTQ